MEKILHYINENYDNSISTQEFEDLACCSLRNAQRLFKRFFDETMNSYQKRLKLENAYKKLVYTSESIKNIGYDVGYDNPSSFTKSFVKQFNISPSEARKNKSILFENFINENQELQGEISYETLYVPEKEVYFKLILTNNYRNDVINGLWDEIEQTIAGGIENSYGLILDQPLISEKSKCRYAACIDVNSVSKDFLVQTIFGMKYVKFLHAGDFDSIENTYRKIFYKWIYELDFEIDNSPIIEQYIEDTDVKNKDGYRTEIYIPIK